MAEAVNVTHAADQMCAGGRTDQRERHGFFQSLVQENPGDPPARIGGGGVGGAPDAVTGAEKNLVGIVWIDRHAARPVRSVARAGVWSHGMIQPAVGDQNPLPCRPAIRAAKDFILQTPPVYRRGQDGGRILCVNRYRAVTPAQPLAVGGCLRRDVDPRAALGIVFPKRAVVRIVRTWHRTVADVKETIHRTDDMVGPQADGLADNRLPTDAAIVAAEKIGAASGNRRVNHRCRRSAVSAGRSENDADNAVCRIATTTETFAAPAASSSIR